MPRHLAIVVAIAVVTTVRAAQAPDRTNADAASMTRKLAIIAAAGDTAAPRGAAGRRSTSFTDNEINAYFKVHGREFLPAGVVDPQVTTGGGGRVDAQAKVDLDAVRKAQARSMSMLNPLAYLSGTYDLHIAARLHGEDGMGMLTLDSVTLGGIPIPVSVLQQIVTYYSKSPELPQGFDLTRPFPLPARITAVDVERGVSTVVQ